MIQPRFNVLLLEALHEFRERGYTSEFDLQDWLRRLRIALEYELPQDEWTRKELTRALTSIYNRDVVRGAVAKYVPGVSCYTLGRIQPSLRAELDLRSENFGQRHFIVADPNGILIDVITPIEFTGQYAE